MSYIQKKRGKTLIPLKFGTNAFELFCKLHGKELHEMGDVLTSPGGERDLIFCAHQAACLSAGKDTVINRYQVGDWLDDMEQADYDDIYNAVMESKISGTRLKDLAEKEEESK